MNTLSFGELNFENIGEWPIVLKYVSLVVLMLLLVGLGYWLVIKPNSRDYDALVSQEKSLRKQLEDQQREAAHLHDYRQQLLVMQHHFSKIRKQLSKHSEILGLLADISKTGINSGLTFELFAPQSEISHDFYNELPINLVVIGNYQQLAVFVSQIAQMSRIVTLHNFEITPYAVDPKYSDSPMTPKSSEIKAGLLSMIMVVKVYWVGDGDGIREINVIDMKENFA